MGWVFKAPETKASKPFDTRDEAVTAALEYSTRDDEPTFPRTPPVADWGPVHRQMGWQKLKRAGWAVYEAMA